MGAWKGKVEGEEGCQGYGFGRRSSSVDLGEFIKVKKEEKYWTVKKKNNKTDG